MTWRYDRKCNSCNKIRAKFSLWEDWIMNPGTGLDWCAGCSRHCRHRRHTMTNPTTAPEEWPPLPAPCLGPCLASDIEVLHGDLGRGLVRLPASHHVR
jgi:hypothetical protein